MNLVSITDARNNLSKLVDAVARKRETYVLLRDSVPQAVVVGYSDYVRVQEGKDKLWQMEFDRLRKDISRGFRKWAGKRGINVDKLTEEEMYELIDKVSGRN